MKDNELLAIIVPTLKQGLADFIANNYWTLEAPLVVRNYQPTQQGTSTSPIVFIHKISDHRYGFPKRKDYWDGVKMVHEETEVMETVFQISTLVIENPEVISQTASDLANAAAIVMQSDSFLSTLKSNGLGIYRITDIRNPYFEDDRDRWEANPSFDFTITHNHITITQTPIITKVTEGLYPI